MPWFLPALLSPALWALTNHIDKYLISKYCTDKSIGMLVTYSGLVGIPISIIIFIFNKNVLSVDFQSIVAMLLTGSIYMCAIIAYFIALKKDDASTVAPLFQMTSIFSLISGYLIFNEQLTQNQIIGAFIILIASIGLSIEANEMKTFSFKKGIFLLMMGSSILLTVSSSIFKIYTRDDQFWENSFWVYIGYAIYVVLLILINNRLRNEFASNFKMNSPFIISINLFNELIALIGNLIFNFTLLIAPIGLVYFVSEGTQPFFVFMYGVILTKFFPKLSQENLQADHLIQKVLAIILMAVGVYLVSS